jgi:CRISPR-associated protein Csm4
MKAKLFKLKFTSPFHLNPARDSLEKTETAIQSDMLVSALAVCHAKLYGEFCEAFFTEKLRVSSLFPFYKDTLFFPVPLFDFWQENIPQKKYKKLNKIKYLDVSSWQRVVSGERLKENEVHPMGIFGLETEKSEISDFFREEEVQRLGKDPFYFSQVRLNEEGGLFFLFDVNPEIEQKFKASLRLLGDEGIGSDKTVGKGLFEIKEEGNFELPDIDSSYMMSLSFFIPSEHDKIDFNKSFYLLQHKRGWYITHKVLSLKKKGIFGFSEGSVFRINKKPTGKKVILLRKKEMEFKTDSPFDILRSGFIYGIPVNPPVSEVGNG